MPAKWCGTLIQGLAVPNYLNAQSIADLKGHGAEFNGRFIGIESGYGHAATASERHRRIRRHWGWTPGLVFGSPRDGGTRLVCVGDGGVRVQACETGLGGGFALGPGG